MEIFVKYIVPILAMLVLSPALNAADIAAGKARAAICAACHGTAGISPNDLWPNLAGQKKTYLVRQIKAFRDGDRVDPMMAPMVRSLTDTDVEERRAQRDSGPASALNARSDYLAGVAAHCTVRQYEWCL